MSNDKTDAAETPGAASNRSYTLLGLTLMFIVALTFVPSVRFGYLNWDDPAYVVANPWLGTLSLRNVVDVFCMPYYFNYHPFTVLSYMLEHTAFGYSPAANHTTNIVLHALAVLGMFRLLRLLKTDAWTSFFFCLFFALHPLRLESVVWISERKDVLCAAFYVWAVCCWVQAGQVRAGRERWLLCTAVTLALCAFFSKIMAVSFPAVVLVHDALFRRDRMRSRLGYYAALMVVALIFTRMNFISQAEAMHEGTQLVEKFKVAIYAPWHYVMKTIVPMGLSPLYPYELRPWTQTVPFLMGLGICVVILFMIVMAARKAPVLSFGLLAGGIIYGPVSGLVGLGSAFAADRYTYLPSMFVLAGMAPLVSSFMTTWPPRQKRGACAVAVVLSIVLAAITLNSMSVWRSSKNLWTRVLAVYPDATLAKKQLADAWSMDAAEAQAAGNAPETEQLCNEALAIYPGDGKALQIMTDLLLARNEVGAAEALLVRATQAPQISAAPKAYAYAMRSVIARNGGDEEKAAVWLQEAFPSPMPQLQTSAENNFIASIAERAGAHHAAEELYRRTLLAEPSSIDALQNLAIMMIEQGRAEEALTFFKQAVEYHPNDEGARQNLRLLEQQLSGDR